MSRKNTKLTGEREMISRALSGMKSGEVRHVRVRPGREGLITMKKPHEMMEGFQLNLNKKRKSKIIY